MLKRLGIGLVKGLVVGGALGAALHFGLGWTVTAGLAGYLLAMGIGATAGILCGKPPWRAGAWIESLLKGVFGLGIGALLFWVTSSYLGVGLPIDLFGVEAGTSWATLPLLYAPMVAAVFGAVVELDNTDESASGSKKVRHEKAPRTRVAMDELGEDLEEVAPKRAKKQSKEA